MILSNMHYIYYTIYNSAGTQQWRKNPSWNSTLGTIESSYDIVLPAGTFYLAVEKDGNYGYMNYLSNWIRDPSMTDARPFLEGVAVCKNTEGYYGVIDTDGNTVIPFNYQYISNISGATLVAYSETGGWTVYQKLTK